TESHGLNIAGIQQLAKKNYSLIITCDTGSTNIAEIEYANNLGIDIIVTDHHTLPTQRPPLLAIINPRNLSPSHPLYNLSGVGVAYKLIEALYLTHPEIPKLPLKELLDLVAIGLIADLVQLTEESRYLAQIGIEKLSTQLQKTTRPGVAKLLELCKKTGDRPTDISFGIGPRINAVSRIIGDASFCVELLTSRDPQHCQQLAIETELANSRRKSLQKEVVRDVTQKLTKLDLSTTNVIVLTDPQWPVGVLGLVAGQIAQEYNRPTILLTEETEAVKSSEEPLLARGSARSVAQIDLYQLVKHQEHLLHRFGGHPFAAGLSLPIENIPIFTDAINQLLGQTLATTVNQTSTVKVDLIVTVSELGRDLFQEFKLLEPCGMGHPVPKLLVQNCWFSNVWHRNQKDLNGKKVQYIKTDFEICDESGDKGFPGVWWGHYKDEIPEERCDAVVELDFNAYKKRYEVRLIAVQPSLQNTQIKTSNLVDWIWDWRNTQRIGNLEEIRINSQKDLILLKECPTSWNDLRIWFRQAINQQKKLAIAYSQPPIVPPTDIWQQLLGIAKYLSRTAKPVTRYQLLQKLGISDATLKLGFQAIQHLCFNVKYKDQAFYITKNKIKNQKPETQSKIIRKFLAAISEEQFRQKYFCEVPLKTIEAIAAQTILEDTTISIPF
ncbi:MAG: single-stranded-DNA-specific exonuclease RecJ, partial [Okeania sp. SIO2D1]|nr:single-stranded-DNA-specific exonuclease RecJ [Okeania sp. SIO2D1]